MRPRGTIYHHFCKNMATSKNAFQITSEFYLQSFTITDVKRAIRADRVLGKKLRSGLLELVNLELVDRRAEATIQKAAIQLLRSPGEGGPQYTVTFAKTVYQEVEKQLRKLFCSPNGGPYRKELEHAQSGVHVLVSALAAKLAAILGIDGPVLIAAVYAVLLIIIKMGKNVWCNITRAKNPPRVAKKAPAKRTPKVASKTASKAS